MLYITGASNPSLSSIGQGWLSFGERWNSLITNIRRYFKHHKIYYIRTWQSQENGYPHFHALVYFEGKSFTVVKWKHPNRKISYRLPSRIKNRTAIKKAWKFGNIDIVAVDDTQDALKDLLKYITRD